MRLRFLETVPSAHPAYPFLAGQIIACDRLTGEFRRYLREQKLQILPEAEAPELATVESQERAVLPRGKRR